MIEKMKLLHITGPRDDIDRVMDAYISRYEIHFENAAANLSSIPDARPFAGTNVYKDTFARAKQLWAVFTAACRERGILYDMKSIIRGATLNYGDRQLTFFD